MRIAYLVFQELQHGVAKKISMQLEYWFRHGHEAVVFCVLPFPGAPPLIPEARRVTGRTSDPRIDSRFLLNTVAFYYRNLSGYRLSRELARFKPDLVYMRYEVFNPFLLRALRDNAPFVIEMNSDDVNELIHYGYLPYLYNRFTRRLLISKAAGLVCVTPEIESLLRGFAVPKTVVTNGADLDAIPGLPAPCNAASPNLVFVGTRGQAWHGVDKILRMAAMLPEFVFHLVGPERTDHADAPRNVVIHGARYGKELEEIYARCDAAIGTLALHRKKMTQACPLKSREYLAHGIPTIIAYEDPDIVEDFPFVLKIPNAEDNVERHLGEIRAFVRRSVGTRVDRKVLEPLIHSARKEHCRLAFLSHCWNLAMSRAASGRRGAR